MSDPLYADPENLASYSRPYVAASQEWSRLAQTVADLRARYQGVWGNDELGHQFGPSFVEGMDSIEERVKAVGTELTVHAEGLVESSRIFRDAREDADFVANTFRTQSANTANPAPTRENVVAFRVAGDTPALTRENVVQLPGHQDAATPPGVYVRSVNPHDQLAYSRENLMAVDSAQTKGASTRQNVVRLPSPDDSATPPGYVRAVTIQAQMAPVQDDSATPPGYVRAVTIQAQMAPVQDDLTARDITHPLAENVLADEDRIVPAKRENLLALDEEKGPR